MVQQAASSSTNIQAEIQGEISGQVIVGNHNVQIHAEHGALVNVISGDKAPVPRPRPTPVVSLLPRRFRGLLDRKAEIGSVTSAFLSEAPVEIYGEAGMGKTSLLRHLAHQPEVDRFSAGVVYRLVRREASADLLQFLFDAFYESDVPFKPTDTQVRQFLRDKQALVLLDDVELTRQDLEGLMDAVPSCAFVVASAGRRLWGEVQSIAVHGLPNEDALALVERELGRPLTSEERDGALALCAAVECNPLRILQEVAAARDERRSLLATAQLAQTALTSEDVTGPALASLSESQRSILGVMAAFGGASVHAEHLAALSGLPDSETVVQALQERNLVQAVESRLRLTGNLPLALEKAWDLTPWKERAITYFITWAEQHRHLPDRLLEEVDCVRELLDWAGATGRWREAQRLGRAMEAALTLSGRWEAWRSMVQSVLQASRALGDQAGAGWAFHQLGSRALCLTEESDARNYLSEALEIRQSLGDRLGAAVTRHNLDILLAPPVPADDSGSSISGSGSSMHVPLVLKVAVTAILVGLGGLGLWKVMGGRSVVSPTGLSAAIGSPTEVDLSWSDRSDNEAEFRIERKGDGIFKEVARVPSNSTSFKDENLSPNTGYTYRLMASSADEESEYSNETSVLTLPAAPSALSLREVSPTSIELGWTDNNPNPSASRVERSIDGGVTFNLLATVAAGTTTYSDAAIPADPTLYYRVGATNASGDSGYSNFALWSASPKPPSAPRLIEAQVAFSTQVNIRWTDGSDNESGFKIERRTGGGSYRQVALVDANATSYEDRGLAADTSYAYRIRATNGAGDSAYTNEAGATTPPAMPAPPSDLIATPATDSSVALSWRDNSDNEAGFYVERRSGDSYQRIGTRAAGASRYADRSLNPETTYSYRVQAFNRAGGSAFSNEATITVPALPGRIEVSPTRVRFASVALGLGATSEVRITNTGLGRLDGSVRSTGAPFKVLSPQEGFSLSPGKAVQVIVEFAPTKAGESTGTLTIKSSDPGRLEVQVSLSGAGKQEPVAVQLLSLSLAVPEVIGGESSEGKVTLSGVAPAGGATVALSSSSAAVGVPRNVVVKGGETSAVVPIKTNRVARNTRATISARLGNDSRTEVLAVSAQDEPQQPKARLESLSLASRVVTGGESSEGKVGLSNAAPAVGATVILSNTSQAVEVPRSVVIQGGETSAVFAIKTKRVARNTRATISASLGTDRRSEVLELKAGREPTEPAVKLGSLTLSSDRVRIGQRAVGTVRLSGNAPRDLEVAISSNNTRVATVPNSVTVKEGSAIATFTITTVAGAGPAGVAGDRRPSQSGQVRVTITATLDGRTLTKILTVLR